MVYKPLRIDITKLQLQKALEGRPMKISAAQIGRGTSYISLHPANVKVVEKAAMKGSGCVLNLAPGELLATAEDMKGEGIFGDIWKGVRSSYDWVKRNIINSDIYQQAIKPLVKGLVDTGATALKGMAPQLGTAIDMGKDAIGKETGAFGLKKRRSKSSRKAILQGKGLYLS